MDKYDEDLSQNPFFRELQSEHKELLLRAIDEGWIVCVPRCGTIQNVVVTTDDLLAHILIPSDELPETHFRTLTGKEIRMSNRVLTVENENGQSPFTTQIIFEETFYTEELVKYKVWCLDAPIERTTTVPSNSSCGFENLASLRDCIDLLCSTSLGKTALNSLDKLIQNFQTEYPSLAIYSLQSQIELVRTLYGDCLQELIRQYRFREGTNRCFLENIKLATETYIQHSIYQNLFEGICYTTAIDDSKLNKVIRNLFDVQLRDLEVRYDLYETVPYAKHELAKISGFSTILGKVGCLRRTIASTTKKTPENLNAFLTADELLPIVVFLVIKTGLANWIAHLTFMTKFRYSTSHSDEVSFLLTTLEAAIEHIRSESLINLDENLFYDNQIISIQRLNNDKKYHYDDTTSIQYLFEQIRQSNHEEIKKILNQTKAQVSNDKTAILCHPLCYCDKCEHIISRNNDQLPTVNSCDDRGFTALHIACLHGNPKTVELLLSYNSDINFIDYSGATPLHYAALRGHQNALLLLLHSGANINAVDSEKNTPLHFASNNGHDGCVKALLYFSEHKPLVISINATNAFGDTPLHHASRWGYEQIVEILLDYGADVTIENLRKLTPLNYAHSLRISRLLARKRITNKINILPLNFEKNQSPQLDFYDDNLTKDSLNLDVASRPQSIRQIKKLDSLLRAVAFGDINLTCYYLNIPAPNEKNEVYEESSEKLCHPLCTCESCIPKLNVVNENRVQLRDGLDVNICNSDGVTPLHVAAMHGWLEITKLLLDNGALPDVGTKTKGHTALHLACQQRRALLVRALLDSRMCTVDKQDHHGNTALYYVCHVGDVRLAQLLVNAGANPLCNNFDGVSPMKIAEKMMFISLVKYFKTLDLDEKNKK